MECSTITGVYKRRKPQETSLWKLLNGHFVEFEEVYDELFLKKYRFYRPVISRVVRKYLACGDLHQGFARIKCPDCHHQFILAFLAEEDGFSRVAIIRKWFSLVIISKRRSFIPYLSGNMFSQFPKY